MAENEENEGQETEETQETEGSTDSKTGQNQEGEKKKDWTPPSQQEWEKVLKASEKYMKEAKTRREKLEELERKTLPEAEQKIEAAKAEAVSSVTARYHGIIAKQAAKASLLSAGLQGDADDALELVKLDNLSIEDSGEVSGLDSEIDRIKTKFPMLFAKPKTKHADGAPKREAPGTAEDPVYGVLRGMGLQP